MGKLIVVAGAQYGSEGKGAVAGHLTEAARNEGPVIAVRVAGPNAGHTVYGNCTSLCEGGDDHYLNGVWIGHPWRLRSLPVSVITNPNATLVIAAGSEIHLDVLGQELEALLDAGYDLDAIELRLLVDSQATHLTDRHINEEVKAEIQKRLGSTAKGIGAARADRIWRTAELMKDAWTNTIDTAAYLRDALLNHNATVMIEGTQGYGLGLHAGAYPKCTSSDCRAIDFLAMAGLSPWQPGVDQFEVWLAARVRPIRVAGNSGPMKGETSWAELGLPEEFTTVTKKVRRVGEWDADLVRNAVKANGGGSHPTDFSPVRIALTMVDTLFPEVVGRNGSYWGANAPKEFPELDAWIAEREREVGAHIAFVGTGPTTGLWR